MNHSRKGVRIEIPLNPCRHGGGITPARECVLKYLAVYRKVFF